MVGVIMKPAKNKTFTDTAETYLYQLAAERTMDERIPANETLMEEYVTANDNTTRAMRFGTEQEPIARLMYASVKQVTVEEVGSIPHPSLGFFASSPDGLYTVDDQKVCVEIKCPNQNTFMRYAHLIRDAKSLKSVKPEYYWQCVSHMAVTGADCTDFVAYSPWQSEPLHIVRIKRDESEINLLIERVKTADLFIEKIINETLVF